MKTTEARTITGMNWKCPMNIYVGLLIRQVHQGYARVDFRRGRSWSQELDVNMKLQVFDRFEPSRV
jgi:hypothetical protein